MPYTEHGHWYGHDHPTGLPPDGTMDCGGLALCPDCAREAHQAEGIRRVPTPPIWPIVTATAPVGVTFGQNIAHPTVTVCRMVHYSTHGTPAGDYAPACVAAIVTQVVGDLTVGLVVLNPTGLSFNVAVPYSATPTPGTWHWPEHA